MHLAANQQVESLVGAAQLDVGLKGDRVISLSQRVEQFVHGNGLFFVETLVEVLAFEHLRDRKFGGKADPVRRLQLVEPLAIETGLGLGLGKNLEDLRHVGFGVAHDFFRAKRRTGSRAARGIANHAGEVADQKDDGVAEVLKVFELAQEHRVAEMQVGRGGIKSGLDPKWLARGASFLQLGAEFALANNFRRAFLDVSQLFVNREERGHRVKIIAASADGAARQQAI